MGTQMSKNGNCYCGLIVSKSSYLDMFCKKKGCSKNSQKYTCTGVSVSINNCRLCYFLKYIKNCLNAYINHSFNTL